MTEAQGIQMTEKWAIKDIVPWDKNPRDVQDKDIERLKSQIKRFGQYKPVIVNTNPKVAPIGAVAGGNMRLRAFTELGFKEVWVIPKEFKSEKEMIEISLSDNDRVGYYNKQGLIDLVTGKDVWYHDIAVDLKYSYNLGELIADNAPEDAKDDNAPEAKKTSKSKHGDMYALGDHRLLCGDCTNPSHVSKLMNGVKANMCFTDPPYNVDYEGGMKADGKAKRDKIKNDKMGDVAFQKFMEQWIEQAMDFTTGAFYICMGSSQIHTLRNAYEKMGGHWQDYVIWVKNTFTMGRSDYQRQYEMILYGWNKHCKKHYFTNERDRGDVWEDMKLMKTTFDGEYTSIKLAGFEVKIKGNAEGMINRKRMSTNIWRYDKPTKSAEHPTMKPVAMVCEAIKNSSKMGQIVFDPFMGSGTTLIACDKTKRKAYGMEIDPIFFDVEIKRWEEYANLKAAKLA